MKEVRPVQEIRQEPPPPPPQKTMDDVLKNACTGTTFGIDYGLDDQELKSIINFVLSDPAFPDYIQSVENMLFNTPK